VQQSIVFSTKDTPASEHIDGTCWSVTKAKWSALYNTVGRVGRDGSDDDVKLLLRRRLLRLLLLLLTMTRRPERSSEQSASPCQPHDLLPRDVQTTSSDRPWRPQNQ